jgi:hypothetical protein
MNKISRELEKFKNNNSYDDYKHLLSNVQTKCNDELNKIQKTYYKLKFLEELDDSDFYDSECSKKEEILAILDDMEISRNDVFTKKQHYRVTSTIVVKLNNICIKYCYMTMNGNINTLFEDMLVLIYENTEADLSNAIIKETIQLKYIYKHQKFKDVSIEDFVMFLEYIRQCIFQNVNIVG